MNLFCLSRIIKSIIDKREWGHGIISEEFRKWVIVVEPVAVWVELVSPVLWLPRIPLRMPFSIRH